MSCVECEVSLIVPKHSRRICEEPAVRYDPNRPSVPDESGHPMRWERPLPSEPSGDAGLGVLYIGSSFSVNDAFLFLICLTGGLQDVPLVPPNENL